jgi:hypothetical protein
MLRRSSLLAWLLLAPISWAQDAPAPEPLSKDQIAAALMDENMALPVPGELFSALGKSGKLDWSTLVRRTPGAAFGNRQQIALNLGALVADGYLAIEAQDKQQVKNIAREIHTLAKKIGVGEDLIGRGKEIEEFADSGHWDTLKESLENAQNEVIAAMKAHGDPELVTLVILGGWLRGTEAVSTYLAKNYTAGGAKVLRQPAIVDYFVQKLAVMPAKIIDTPLMTAVRTTLFEIKKAVTFGVEVTPTAADVQKLSDLATELQKKISTKE